MGFVNRQRISASLVELGTPVEQQIQRFCHIGIACLFITVWLILPHMKGFLASTLYVGCVLPLLVYYPHILVRLLGPPLNWRLTEATRPLLFEYGPHNMRDMFQLRKYIHAHPEYRQRCVGISVGSYWTETICSVLLFSEVYNSIYARRALAIFFNYILPVVFTFQVRSSSMGSLLGGM